MKMGHYKLQNSEVNYGVEKAIELGFGRYSVAKIGEDSPYPSLVEEYFDSLKSLLEKEGLKFVDYRFFQPHKQNELWIIPSRVFVIGENGNKAYQTLVEAVKTCPEGLILEEIRRELSENPGRYLNNTIDSFLEQTRDRKEKVLTIMQGPETYSSEELTNIKKLFISDNERFVRPFDATY